MRVQRAKDAEFKPKGAGLGLERPFPLEIEVGRMDSQTDIKIFIPKTGCKWDALNQKCNRSFPNKTRIGLRCFSKKFNSSLIEGVILYSIGSMVDDFCCPLESKLNIVMPSTTLLLPKPVATQFRS